MARDGFFGDWRNPYNRCGERVIDWSKPRETLTFGKPIVKESPECTCLKVVTKWINEPK
jgi:hypothetical protein